jgi:hypothetical protein
VRPFAFLLREWPDVSEAAGRELFHVCFWLARTYGRAERPSAGLVFDPARLPRPGPSPKQPPVAVLGVVRQRAVAA